MIYNFNLGIGWASSGVEYAQSYRAKMLRNIGKEAKFIFTDMFPRENIEHMTDNIGFLDSEVIWLYSYFTDFKISPVTYTLKDFEETFTNFDFTFTRDKKIAKYIFKGTKDFYTVYMVDERSDKMHRVEYVHNGCLVRKDYFTYGRLYTEFYAPLDGKAHLYHRRFYNTDGTPVYDEIIDDDHVVYKFKDKILFSKEEFVGYFVSTLNLTKEDTVIIDRTTGVGQSILMNVKDARVGIVIHADHFSESGTNDDVILWNNYYEYAFNMHKHIDFYITATDEQNILLKQQFKKYKGVEPTVYTIPVGSLPCLKYPKTARKPYSLITASRLADEKHVDWIINAVVKAKVHVPELTLDIYGKGANEDTLRQLIQEHHAEDYIVLKGQQDLKEVYQNYEAYISGSTSEGFGLTLMEAVGGGCPIIGFDVRYGNPTFIDHEQNGYLIDIKELKEVKDKVNALSTCIVKLMNEADIDAFHAHAYEVASRYLTQEVEKRWQKLVD